MGVTWETISPDLTAHPACCQGASGEPITRDVTGEEFYSTLYAITESPHRGGRDLDGLQRRPVLRHARRRQDAGRTSRPRTCRRGPRGVHRRLAAPARARRTTPSTATCWATTAPYIYRTDDYGKTLDALTDGKNGIPADEPTRVVREDPEREGLLYAGTEFGLYISFDDGGHWQPFQLNLPNVPDQRHPGARTRTWSSPRRAGPSGSSTTSARCIRSRRRPAPPRRTCTRRATATGPRRPPSSWGPWSTTTSRREPR